MSIQFDKISENNGEVICNKSILLSIITLATREISGVAGMDDSFTSKLKDKLSENYFEGAKISSIGNKLIVDVYIKVYSNYNVSEIAYKVQQNIKNSMSNMVDVKLDKVNIHVVDVVLKEDKE